MKLEAEEEERICITSNLPVTLPNLKVYNKRKFKSRSDPPPNFSLRPPFTFSFNDFELFFMCELTVLLSLAFLN